MDLPGGAADPYNTVCPTGYNCRGGDASALRALSSANLIRHHPAEIVRGNTKRSDASNKWLFAAAYAKRQFDAIVERCHCPPEQAPTRSNSVVSQAPIWICSAASSVFP